MDLSAAPIAVNNRPEAKWAHDLVLSTIIFGKSGIINQILFSTQGIVLKFFFNIM
jgi:hypothetical protein